MAEPATTTPATARLPLSQFLKAWSGPLGLPSRLISCPCGAVIAWLVQRTPISPNVLTTLAMLWLAVGLAPILVLDWPLWTEALWLFCVLQFRYIIDCADGCLARTTNQKSLFGAMYDKVADIWGDLGPPLVLACTLAHQHTLELWQAAALAGNIIISGMQHVAGWLKDAERRCATAKQETQHKPAAAIHRRHPLAVAALNLMDVPVMSTILALAWGFGLFWQFLAAEALLGFFKLLGFLIKAKSDMREW